MPKPKSNRPSTPSVCPVCGEDVPRNALACPECGADERSGWREDAGTYDGVDLPEDFDYDEFVRDELGSRLKPKGIPVFWWITAIVVIIGLALVLIRQGRF